MQIKAISKADKPEGSQENNRLNISNIRTLLAEIFQQAKNTHNTNGKVKYLADHERKRQPQRTKQIKEISNF